MGGISPITQTFYPRIAHLMSNDKAQAMRTGRFSVWLTVGTGVAAGVVLFASAPWLVRLLLGRGFENSIPVLRLFSLLPALIAGSNVLGIQWMFSLRLDKEVNVIITSAGALNLVLALLLTPRYHQMGNGGERRAGRDCGHGVHCPATAPPQAGSVEHHAGSGRGRRMKVDWLIVGAGFTGAVLAERIASQLNQKVLVVDSRDHIGGNAYDYYDEHGILVHKYGAHIFHTNSEKIWTYLSAFTSWRPYFHQVQAAIDGKLVPVPFNLNTLDALFPRSMAEGLERSLVERYGFGAKVPILKMMEEEGAGLKELARYIYKNVFHDYTVKQWALKPEELDPSVTGRVPVFVSRDDRYFQDTYQGIPKHGYTELFRRLLAHPNIHLLLKTDHREAVAGIKFDRMVFTGPIDQYFDYCYGLPLLTEACGSKCGTSARRRFKKSRL